jgi:hypothetical protein
MLSLPVRHFEKRRNEWIEKNESKRDIDLNGVCEYFRSPTIQIDSPWSAIVQRVEESFKFEAFRLVRES